MHLISLNIEEKNKNKTPFSGQLFAVKILLEDIVTPQGFLGGSVAKNALVMQEMRIRFLGWEDPLVKEMATHSSILVWEIYGQKSLEGYSPQGRKELGTT